MTEQTIRTYTVHGMSCEHCRASVSEEVAEVEGVEHIAVDLDSGSVEVRGRGFSDDAIRAAVEEAGYELAAVR